MLNRYVAEGMVAEARLGRRIMVIGINGVDVHASMDECMSHVHEADVYSERRANGAERITFQSTGRIVFRSYQGHGYRGESVDTLYLDSAVDAMMTDLTQWDSIRSCVASSPTAEIIRA